MTSVYEEMRSKYPTAAELKQRMAFAEEELQSAKSTKQFIKCKELKEAITKFEEELALLCSDNKLTEAAQYARLKELKNAI